MEKRIRASKIEDVPPARPPPSSYSSDQFTESGVQIPRPYAPVSHREKSVAFGMGLVVCIIGVILTPILIGIPIICAGLWMVLFPTSFIRYSRKRQ